MKTALALTLALAFAIPVSAQYGAMPKPHIPPPNVDAVQEPTVMQTSVQGVVLGTPIAAFVASIQQSCGGGVFNPCKKQIKDAIAGKRIAFSSGATTLLFDGGKVVYYSLHFPLFSSVYDAAVSKYGKPTEEHRDQLVDGLGNAFDVLHALWNMPDGSVIVLDQNIGFGNYTADLTLETQAEKKNRDALYASFNHKPIL